MGLGLMDMDLVISRKNYKDPRTKKLYEYEFIHFL